MRRTHPSYLDPLYYFRNFWSRVAKNGPLPDARPELGPCWTFAGNHSSEGYSQFTMYFQGVRRAQSAHRLSYTTLRGPVPDGLTLDHLCRVRSCVNPWHLDAVTEHVNILRGTSPTALNAVKTHCPAGHEYSQENTAHNRGWRVCRECTRARNRIRNPLRKRGNRGALVQAHGLT